ncbi:MAG: hypothetical protein AB4060_06760 [Crocosphaera sp.]
MTREDGFIENLTAIIYFCSFIVSIFWLISFKNTRYFYKIYLAFSCLALIFFLDEISFGQRIYQFKIPRFLGYKVDAIHDVFGLSKFLVKRFLILLKNQVGLTSYSLIILLLTLSIFSLFFMLIFLVIKHYQYLSSNVSNVLQRFPSLIFLLIAVLCGLVSLMIDDFLFNKLGIDFLQFVEELFEMNLSICFLFFSLGMKYDFVGRNNHTLKA